MASLIHPSKCGVRREDLIGHDDAIYIVKSCAMLNANILMVVMAAGALVLVLLASKIKSLPYWVAAIPLVVGALGYLGPLFAAKGTVALDASFRRSSFSTNRMDNIADATMTKEM